MMRVKGGGVRVYATMNCGDEGMMDLPMHSNQWLWKKFTTSTLCKTIAYAIS